MRRWGLSHIIRPMTPPAMRVWGVGVVVVLVAPVALADTTIRITKAMLHEAQRDLFVSVPAPMDVLAGPALHQWVCEEWGKGWIDPSWAVSPVIPDHDLVSVFNRYAIEATGPEVQWVECEGRSSAPFKRATLAIETPAADASYQHLRYACRDIMRLKPRESHQMLERRMIQMAMTYALFNPRWRAFSIAPVLNQQYALSAVADHLRMGGAVDHDDYERRQRQMGYRHQTWVPSASSHGYEHTGLAVPEAAIHIKADSVCVALAVFGWVVEDDAKRLFALVELTVHDGRVVETSITPIREWTGSHESVAAWLDSVTAGR